MQRIFNLDKWRTITEGEAIRFAGKWGERVIRLEVNARDKVRLFVQEDGDEPAFLALVEGRDLIEFTAKAGFDLMVDGGECSFYTADGQDWSIADVGEETFTKIVERRQRNPELELMMAMAQRNMEERLATQGQELERRFQAALDRANDSAVAAIEALKQPPATPDGGGTPPSGGEGAKPAPAVPDGSGA